MFNSSDAVNKICYWILWIDTNIWSSSEIRDFKNSPWGFREELIKMLLSRHQNQINVICKAIKLSSQWKISRRRVLYEKNPIKIMISGYLISCFMWFVKIIFYKKVDNSVKKGNRVSWHDFWKARGFIRMTFPMPFSDSLLATKATKGMNYSSYWIREVPLLPERSQIANSLFLLDYKKLVSTLSFFDLQCEFRKLRLSGILSKRKQTHTCFNILYVLLIFFLEKI